MTQPFRVLSLGAGLDSTTLLLLSEHGELPRLDAAIFADTMAEPQHVYDTLEWLTATVTIPILRVSYGDMTADMVRLTEGQPGVRQYYPPFFVTKADGEPGAPLHRRCTEHYKIRPIKQAIRTLLGLKPKQGIPAGLQVEQWIGFTLDDLGRTFCSDVAWITNTFPLILPLKMKRRDCQRWLEVHGYPVPQKSSCLFCPYHRNSYWVEMRDQRPDEWQRTVIFEQRLQQGKLPGIKGTPYLHKSMLPLPMAPIDVPETAQEELFCMHCNT